MITAIQTTKDKTELMQAKTGIKFIPDDGSNSENTITIDEKQTFQEIDGFGASITDYSANIIYNKMNENDRNVLMKDLFDPASGLGISFLRQPIGGPDFVVDFDRKNDYTYDDVQPGETDLTLAKFTIQHDVPYIIPLLNQAYKINPDIKVFASPWSPPAWMKTNGSITGGGNLNPAYYEAYANYFVKYIKAYSEKGIPISYVTTQNEPNNSGNFPSMRMNSTTEKDFVKNYLAPAFKKNNIQTQIVVYDNDWSDYNYPSDILSDSETRSLVAGSAFHWYSGYPEAMSFIHKKFPDKGIWITEASGGIPCDGFPISQKGTWGEIFDDTFKTLVIKGMQNWAKSIVFWNIAMNPDPMGNRGVATVDPQTGKVGELSQEYCILSHTSKYIKPSAVRIGANSFEEGNIMDVAFKNKDGSIVLLVYNDASQSRSFKVKWQGSSFNYTIPAGAVATFKW